MSQSISSSLALSLLTSFFLAIISFTIPIMASLYIVSDLGGSPEISVYSISFYGLGNALSLPLGKILPSRIGASNTLSISLLLFALFTLLCAVSTNYPFFISMRFFQGLALGPLFIVVMMLFHILLPKEKLQLVSSINMIMFSSVPAIGACWGGWLAYNYDWRAIFYLNIPLVLFLAWFIRSNLKDEHLDVERYDFDLVGYLSYALAIVCFVFALTTGQEFDWFRSDMISSLFAIGTLSLLFFIGWSLTHPSPIIKLRLLKTPLFVFGIVNLAIFFAIYFATINLLALWLHLYANYTPNWIAIILGIMACVCLLPSILILKRFEYIDGRLPLFVALIFMAASSFYSTSFDVEVDIKYLATSRIFAGLALVCFLPSVFRICFHIVPEEKFVEVFNFFQITRVLSSSLGSALFLILWQRRQVFYHERLGESLTSFSNLTKDFFAEAKLFDIKGIGALAKLNEVLGKQSTSLALNDCFYLMGCLAVLLLIIMILTLLIRKKENGIERRVIKFFLFEEKKL